MKKRTIVSIILVILAIAMLSIYALASAIDGASEITQTGLKIKEALDDTLQARIVAEINGVPISASQIELRRIINASNRAHFENLSKSAPIGSIQYDPNDFPLDAKEILSQIAKELFVIKAANEIGISYSDEAIMDMIYAEEEYIRGEIERGNELMIQRQQKDDEFFKSLDMTKDQFYKKIYMDMLRYSNTLVDYCKYYYFESNMFKNNITFESYIDDAFNKAAINIDIKDIGLAG